MEKCGWQCKGYGLELIITYKFNGPEILVNYHAGAFSDYSFGSHFVEFLPFYGEA